MTLRCLNMLPPYTYRDLLVTTTRGMHYGCIDGDFSAIFRSYARGDGGTVARRATGALSGVLSGNRFRAQRTAPQWAGARGGRPPGRARGGEPAAGGGGGRY